MRATKIHVVSDFKMFPVIGTGGHSQPLCIMSFLYNRISPLVSLIALDTQPKPREVEQRKQRLHTIRGGTRPSKVDKKELLKATQPQLCSVSSGKSRKDNIVAGSVPCHRERNRAVSQQPGKTQFKEVTSHMPWVDRGTRRLLGSSEELCMHTQGALST